MIFRWLKRRRRQRLTAAPFPESWSAILRRNVPAYLLLEAPQRQALEHSVQILVAEKNWEGCGGLTIDEEIKVTIAGQASRLLLGWGGDYFDHVFSVLVYPDTFVVPQRTVTEGGLVLEGESPVEGQAWYRGPVILAWVDVLAAGDPENGNVVLHEFAHQLDMLSGRIDGNPVLTSTQQDQRWKQVTQAEFSRLVRDCQHGKPTLLDCYGATHPAEFFAVATESFFEHPLDLLAFHPALYEVLHDYYHQDPAKTWSHLGSS